MHMERWSCVSGVMLTAVSSLALASSPITPHTEYHKRLKSAEQVAPLESDLFGEQIDMKTGSTAFVVTDIDLPGNNALPVRLQRTLAIQSFKNREPLGGFGSWDISVPYLQGTFTTQWKWNESANGVVGRCSSLFLPKVPTFLNLYEVWSGNSVHLPGEGSQELLYIGAADSPNSRPTDGANYNWGTRGSMRFSCLAQTANGYPGEGFVGVDGNGNRYHFNVGLERQMGPLNVGTGAVGLVNVFLMASRVEDRYGNWVAYDYTGDKVTAIRSSDGRAITMEYSGDRIVSASTNGRTWRYEYEGGSGALGFNKWARLSAVAQPDGTQLTYSYAWQDGGFGGLNPEYGRWDGNQTRCEKPDFEPAGFTLVATHPAGARGQFDFEYAQRRRTGIPQNACGQVGNRYYQRVAPTVELFAIRRKTLTGPGLGTQVWSYEHDAYNSGIANTTASTLVEPDGTRTHSIFGIKLDENDGQLLQKVVQHSSGSIAQVETYTYVTPAESPGMPFPERHGTTTAADHIFSTRNLPLKKTVLGRDGVNFSSETVQFDAHARSVVQAESNTLGYARVLRTSFHDDTARWVLGQELHKSHQVGSAPVIDTYRAEFDAQSRPHKTYSFGLLQQSIAYHADGNPASLTDANGNVTTLDAWKRGLPQSIGFPDGTSTQLQVDDNGWIRSVVEPNGARRSFDYDAMGRTTLATQPADDSVAWNPTVIQFSPAGGPGVGLEAGHWKREARTGDALSVSYFDGLWRPVFHETYDAADPAGTVSRTLMRYDARNRTVYASYAAREANSFADALPGTHTEFDALDRIVRTEQDSELGRLITQVAQLGNGEERTTNPRGVATTTAFQMYGKPDERLPVKISHAEGAVTEIQRDPFGKPLSILRRNTDGSVNVRRQYVYDAFQRLCKSMEPESAATLMGYDSVGNLLWSASGMNELGPECASVDDNFVSMETVRRTYDNMNRLLSLRHPYHMPEGDQVWSYWPGGQPRRVETRNEGAITSNEYAYNLRGLPVQERVIGGGNTAWTIGYRYDANGALAAVIQPSGRVIDHAPNALGQATRAGSYASQVRYHANGEMSSFVYGHGGSREQEWNIRGLSDRTQDHTIEGKLHDDGFDYDENGNLVAISDGRPGAPGNRDMQYDGLDRLVSVSAASFGNASYRYDVLDNMVSATVGERRQTFEYDHHNRLTNIRDTDSGATVVGVQYDERGNLNMRNGDRFTFDYGNRLRYRWGGESYRYDAHGRRSLARTNTGSIRSFYGHDGVLRYQHDHRQAMAQDHIYLNGKLIARHEVLIPPGRVVLTAPGYSDDGDYIVEWTTVFGASRYEIEERQGSMWAKIYAGTDIETLVEGRAPGAYRYRGRACNAAGCGEWGAEIAVRVAVAPDLAPRLEAPEYGFVGNFTLIWGAVRSAVTYVVEERGTGDWQQIAETVGLQHQVAGRPAGAYSYRVKSCNPKGCGPFSITRTVIALHKPIAPQLHGLPTSYSGNYVMSMSRPFQAKSYILEEQFNGSAWAEVDRSSDGMVSLKNRVAGQYSYRAYACNEVGCSPPSKVVSVLVTLPPTTQPTLHLEGVMYPTTLTMAWTAVPVATRYELQERAAGHGFVLIENVGNTSSAPRGRAPGHWEYQVRGCNVAGCGPWSNIAGVQLLGPPSMPILWMHNTAGVGAEYHVALSSVPTATGYEIDESGDGVNWQVVSYANGANFIKHVAGNYFYRGRACNPAGCSASSPVHMIAVSGAPPVPTGLRITSSTGAQCHLRWDITPNATGYEVLSLGSTSYATGNVYRFDNRCYRPYKVRACNSQACSEWSEGV